MLKRQGAIKFILKACIITGLIVMAGPAYAQTGMVDKIVAVVNDDIITAHDLNKRLKVVYNSINNAPISDGEKQQAMQQVQHEMLNEMIRETLIKQETKKYGIAVTDAEVNDAINTIKANNNFTDDALREALTLQGFDYESYRDEIGRQILSSKLMNRQIRSRVVVTNEDIERYFNTHAAEYQNVREYKVWNIFTRWSEYGESREREQALRMIDNLYNQLQAGADFIQLVRTGGQTYGGGELGFYKINEIAPEYRDYIAGLQPHSYSQIVMSPQVAQIFYVEEIMVGDNQTLADVKPEIEEILYRQGMEKRFESWMEELYAQSHIEILQD